MNGLRMHFRARGGWGLLLALLGTLSAAQDAVSQSPSAAAATYRIEVMIFTQSGRSDEGDGVPALRSIGEGDAASGSTEIGRVIGVLSGGELVLAGLRERLNRGGYRLLAHGGWVQTASSWGARVGVPLDQLGINAAGLSGSFFLERGQLLHLGMNLRLERANAPAQTLSEIRRVRFNERHYFDHPAIGVIAVVSPAR
jgi:hypothetical protein